MLAQQSAADKPQYEGGKGRGRGRGRNQKQSRAAGDASPAAAQRKYCFLHGYGGHAGADCHWMSVDRERYTQQQRAAKDHNQVAGGSKYNF